LKQHDKPTIIQSDEEREIYSILCRRFLAPKFILFQTTIYPLSALSSYLETDYPGVYDKFNIGYDINIMRSIGAGHEEPYAFSLFLGNILLLSYVKTDKKKQTQLKQSGSALAGLVFSTGNHQICDNIYLNDPWYQFELMLVGKLNEHQVRRMSWNFRLGVKYHKNNLIRDVIILSLEKNNTDWRPTGFSLFKNSIFKYKAYIPVSFSDNPPFSVYQLFSYGKKVPVTLFKKKVFLILAGGVCWDWVYRYDRNLKEFENKPSGHLTWLIQPNIEF